MSDTRSRGRPREFDADDTLERVVGLFWTRGFEATSMSDIVDATGLSKSSLYNAFGSKDELFRQAIDRYLERRSDMLHQALRDGQAGLDDIDGFFRMADQELRSEFGRCGCFAVNTSTELAIRDDSIVTLSAEYRDEIRRSMLAALRRAAQLGEIDERRIASYAEVLTAFMLSLSVFARGGASRTEIDAQFAAIRTVIDGWRLDRP